MNVMLAGKLLSASEEQPEKAWTPMLTRPSGRLVNASRVQPIKAYKPMLLRPSGRLVSVSAEQPAKARSSILVSWESDGRLTVRSDEQ